MLTGDLNLLAVFAALAEAKNFRRAGERLGVSASAVSQALRKLERQLGVVLAHRTSRSVRLTAAGERLYAGVRPALDEVRATVAAVGELGDAPSGALRLSVADAAASFLSGPLLAGFLTEHPHVELNVDMSNAPVDIVREGYDAGIRLGEVIDRDMIAVPVSGDLRLMVVGAPAYFAQRPPPAHPRDLAGHAILNWHATPDAPPYRWEFTEDGRDFSVALRGRVLTTEAAVLTQLARSGVGLAMLYENQVREDVERGDLVPVLEAFSTPFAGFYLYYPQRRQALAPLRALIQYLRAARAPRRRGGSGSGAPR
jgi:DNA-binding transcriptional LysR family regulator